MTPAGTTPVEQSVEPLLLTIPEACERLRISRWMVYRLLQTRQLGSVKIGTRRLIPAAALRSFLSRLDEEDR